MKLPWDRNYFKVSFYAALTFVLCYTLKLVIDAGLYVVTSFGEALNGVGAFFGGFLALFSPLVVGLVAAYILDPLVDFFQKGYDVFHDKEVEPWLKKHKLLRRKKKIQTYKTRTAGAALTYFLIVIVLALFAALLVARLGGGGGDTLGNMVAQVNKTINGFSDTYTKLHIKLGQWGVLEYFSKYLTEFINGVGTFVQNFGQRLINSLSAVGGGVLNFFLGLVISFYFLRDKASLQVKAVRIMESLLPEKICTGVKNVLADIHVIFSGYIRGQLTDALIMAVLISILLSAIGVDYAVIIGMVSGFSNIIPYFGAFIGFGLSVTVALLSGDPMKALYAAIGVLILQQIDGMFIVPKVVGKNVELGPVLVLLSLAVAGQLFGVGGMILAVPVCAMIKIFLQRFLERREREKNEKAV